MTDYQVTSAYSVLQDPRYIASPGEIGTFVNCERNTDPERSSFERGAPEGERIGLWFGGPSLI